LQNLKQLHLTNTIFSNLPEEIGDLSSLNTLGLSCSKILSLPSSIGRLQNLKNLDLSLTIFLNLPGEIGDLSSLNTLGLSCSKILSLPSSIGRLQNLKQLYLINTIFSNLPEEIGDLSSLNTLGLSCSKILSLPSSIGRLQNLKQLHLTNTIFSNLPEEIGDLSSLNTLGLSCSKILSLPSSIGRLQNLKNLDLSLTEHLSNLPEEIGNLVGLEALKLGYKLVFNGTRLTSLPTYIGQLENLKELDLSSTRNLSSLPEEIGNLTNLQILSLHESGMSLLPAHGYLLGRLKSLRQFSVFRSKAVPENIPGDCLLMLLEQCPFLGFLGNAMDGKDTSKTRTPVEKKIWYAMARNRARCRTCFGTANPMSPKLWPLVLTYATAIRAFDRYVDGCYGYYRWQNVRGTRIILAQHDAIYQLLVCGRESFVGILLQRKADAVPTQMEF
jgi:Leucine-rich repeat (LRR) protein